MTYEEFLKEAEQKKTLKMVFMKGEIMAILKNCTVKLDDTIDPTLAFDGVDALIRIPCDSIKGIEQCEPSDSFDYMIQIK